MVYLLVNDFRFNMTWEEAYYKLYEIKYGTKHLANASKIITDAKKLEI